MPKPKIPASAGSKIVRDFIERLMVANKKLRYTDVPLNAKPGTRTTLKPDSVYTSAKPGAKNAAGKDIKYVYTTDGKQRIASAHARPLELPAQNTRGPHTGNTPGKLPGDHAGHLFADMFGGSGKLDNLVSQASDVNLRNMKSLEARWAERLRAGEKIDVDIKVEYHGDGARPTGFKVYEIRDGKRVQVGDFPND